jgi:hypothetical protein
MLHSFYSAMYSVPKHVAAVTKYVFVYVRTHAFVSPCACVGGWSRVCTHLFGFVLGHSIFLQLTSIVRKELFSEFGSIILLKF